MFLTKFKLSLLQINQLFSAASNRMNCLILYIHYIITKNKKISIIRKQLMFSSIACEVTDKIITDGRTDGHGRTGNNA